MEHEKKHGKPRDDDWFDELLRAPALGEEIGPDEQAVAAAGLTRPEDAELERIIQETNADQTMLFDPQEEAFSEDNSSEEPFSEEGFSEEPFSEEGFSEEEAISDDGSFSDDENLPEETPALLPFEDDLIPETDFMQSTAPEQPEPVEEPEAPVRKGRPRMKKGYGLFGIPHLLVTVIWLAIAVAIGVSLGRMLWVCASDVLAFGREDHEYIITIEDGDNIDTIAAKLKNAGLIKYPELFKMYADLTDAESEISPGTFKLNSLYDYHALVSSMTPRASTREEVEVMIPEGYTCAQIFALLEEKGVCTVAKLEEYAQSGELDEYWFLEGVTRGDRYSLEGYLFPDTYRFYLNDDAEHVLEKMLDNFDYRFTDVMKEKIEPLNERMAAVLASRGYSEEEIAKRKFTIREIVIIASMIERETSNDSESFDISSVIYNRLTNPANFPYLNIDATIIYALGGNIDPETGNTKPLTSADLALDHPYNSYLYKGLIPGPISNPGRASLLAALDPNETAYYFYVYNPKTAVHLFGKTAAEHDKNVAYVRSLDD